MERDEKTGKSASDWKQKKKKENITSAPKQGNLNIPEQQSNVELLTLDEARAGSREEYHDINEFQRSAEP